MKDEIGKVEKNEEVDVTAKRSLKFLGVILLAESPVLIWGIIGALKLINEVPLGLVFSVLGIAVLIINAVIMYLITSKHREYKKSAIQIVGGIDMEILIILIYGIFG